jgi:hypothetical protein
VLQKNICKEATESCFETLHQYLPAESNEKLEEPITQQTYRIQVYSVTDMPTVFVP